MVPVSSHGKKPKQEPEKELKGHHSHSFSLSWTSSGEDLLLLLIRIYLFSEYHETNHHFFFSLIHLQNRTEWLRQSHARSKDRGGETSHWTGNYYKRGNYGNDYDTLWWVSEERWVPKRVIVTHGNGNGVSIIIEELQDSDRRVLWLFTYSQEVIVKM